MRKIWNRYECPDCEQQFAYAVDPDGRDGPDFCPKCGSNLSDNPPDEVELQRMNIQTIKGKIGDQVYRQMETAADARIEEVAEKYGMDKSELSDMKITNMRDNMREGDIAAITPAPKVPLAIQNFQNPAAVSAFTQGSMSGPYAGAGNAARQMVNNNFHADRARMEASPLKSYAP